MEIWKVGIRHFKLSLVESSDKNMVICYRGSGSFKVILLLIRAA